MKRFAIATLVLATTSAYVVADSWSDYASKIHGKDSSGNKIVCGSYESDLTSETQRYLIEHAMLAAAAYQDGADAYGNVTRKDAYKETSYTPLTKAEVEKYIAGSGLSVIGDDATGVTVCGANAEALNAALFKDAAGNIVVSYRGSKEVVDWVDDAKQVLGKVPEQYEEASRLLRAVIDNTAAEGNQIICDGHSLGGGLLAYAMADNDIMATGEDGKVYARVTGNTYNAAGLSDKVLDLLAAKPGGVERIKNASNAIINIRNQQDPVSYVAYHLGNTYEVTWTASADNAHTILNDHGIEKLTENMIAGAGFDSVWNIINSPAGGSTPTTGGPTTSSGGGSGGGYTGYAGKIAGYKIGAKILNEASKLIDNQIAKIAAKHPFIGEAMKALGINGQSITNTVINVLGTLWKAPSLKAAFASISHMAVEGLKNMAASLIKYGLDKLAGFINNMVSKVLTWLENKLLSWVNSVKNPCLKKALGYALAAYSKWKNSTGGVIVGNTVRGAALKVLKKAGANAAAGGSSGGVLINDIIQRVK